MLNSIPKSRTLPKYLQLLVCRVCQGLGKGEDGLVDMSLEGSSGDIGMFEELTCLVLHFC